MRDLVVATKNAKKLRELRRYLKGVKANVVSLSELDRAIRIVENGSTFKANAIKKAMAVSKALGGLAIADDSGLEVAALKGGPGVKSARYAGPKKRDFDNNLKVLKLLKDIPDAKRCARFVCAVAIVDNRRVVKVIEGYCPGRIAHEMCGHHGFGYDSLFLIPKYKKTFGQLGLKVKDRMSHRSKALKKVREFLRRYLK